jgi:riboflavin-specific deaminase-like protein
MLLRFAQAPDRASSAPPRRHDAVTDSWRAVPELMKTRAGALPPQWADIFEPLRSATADEQMVIGQIGQSLDGRVATATGHSHYINGPAGLAHLHRLRAVVDVVVIGVGTAIADDPQLTVRRVAGPNPARVVIDPHGRLSASARLFATDGVQRLAVTAAPARPALPNGAEVVALPADNGHIAPAAILNALAERGLHRVLVEGGAETVSQFLLAGCLDRLHVVVAPVILGSGRASFILPAIDRVDHALRPPMRAHRLDDGEVLFDCDLTAQRVAAGRAKKST